MNSDISGNKTMIYVVTFALLGALLHFDPLGDSDTTPSVDAMRHHHETY